MGRIGTRLGGLGLCLALCAAGCRHTATDKERQGSDIHYDLGIQAQTAGNLPGAYGEFEQALTLDPQNARAHNAMGLLLHLGFHKLDEALAHFQKALEIDPNFSEARVNLGNLYVDQGRYAEAAKLYEQSLNDMRYETPYLAQGNLGWAYYKLGRTDEAIDQIKAAVTLNPKFCLGFRNLGTIFDETGKLAEACHQFQRYREACPDVPDAYRREGVCLAKQGKQEDARDRFAQCVQKSPDGELKDDCRTLLCAHVSPSEPAPAECHGEPTTQGP